MSNDGTLRPLASRTNWTPSSFGSANKLQILDRQGIGNLRIFLATLARTETRWSLKQTASDIDFSLIQHCISFSIHPPDRPDNSLNPQTCHVRNLLTREIYTVPAGHNSTIIRSKAADDRADEDSGRRTSGAKVIGGLTAYTLSSPL